jgi:uncharacterized protein
MEFEWDENKNQWNIAQRGFDFAFASGIFEKPVYEGEAQGDYAEIRIKAIGKVENIVLCVIYTRRENRIRIISARKASRNERRIYSESETTS